MSLIAQLETPCFEASWEELVSHGLEARQQRDDAAWTLGALADKVEKIYGFDALGKFSVEVGIEKRTLQRYRDVSRGWSNKNRQPQLSFSHHKIALGSDDPEGILKTAADNSWSCEKLALEIKGKPIEAHTPPEYCLRCGGWKADKICGCRIV